MKERYETGFGEEIWDFSWNEEKNFGEYAKEEIIENITQIKIIVQQAEKENVELKLYPPFITLLMSYLLY